MADRCGPRTAGHDVGEMELHQVPDRPRRAAAEALWPDRHARVDARRHRSGACRLSGGRCHTPETIMFEHVEPFAGDPILSLNEEFQSDPRPGKINLSIGIYFDDEGRTPVLESVRRAEQRVGAAAGAKPYLPMEGAANFRGAVQELLFGAGHEALGSGRVATIQSIGS